MRLWELRSICRDQPSLLLRKATGEWQEYAEWYRQFDELVQTQDRAKLDYELPEAYVLAVLGETDLAFYQGDDGWLRSRRLAPTDHQLSALEAYERYGGSAVEDALEKGSVPPADRGR